MSNPATVVPFHFDSHEVRTVTDERGEAWFAANDVSVILGYKNPRTAVANHCRQVGVLKQDTLTEKGTQEMTYINEGNLYRLIIKSRKPQAERFEQMVMEEILPAIRKTGHYSATASSPAPPPQSPVVTKDGMRVYMFQGVTIFVFVDPSDGKAWFRVHDLGHVLGYRNYTHGARLRCNFPPATFRKLTIMVSDIYRRESLFTDHAGVENLILRSRSPKTASFAQYYQLEILPSLQRGRIEMPDEGYPLYKPEVGSQGKHLDALTPAVVEHAQGIEEAGGRRALSSDRMREALHKKQSALSGIEAARLQLKAANDEIDCLLLDITRKGQMEVSA